MLSIAILVVPVVMPDVPQAVVFSRGKSLVVDLHQQSPECYRRTVRGTPKTWHGVQYRFRGEKLGSSEYTFSDGTGESVLELKSSPEQLEQWWRTIQLRRFP